MRFSRFDWIEISTAHTSRAEIRKQPDRSIEKGSTYARMASCGTGTHVKRRVCSCIVSKLMLSAFTPACCRAGSLRFNAIPAGGGTVGRSLSCRMRLQSQGTRGQETTKLDSTHRQRSHTSRERFSHHWWSSQVSPGLVMLRVVHTNLRYLFAPVQFDRVEMSQLRCTVTSYHWLATGQSYLVHTSLNK